MHASTTRPALGLLQASSFLLYGMGMSAWVTRRTGASRIVEGLLHEDGDDLGTDPYVGKAILHVDGPVRPCHGLQDGIHVEGTEGPKVQHVGPRSPPWANWPAACSRYVYHPAVGDDGHVVALALPVRQSQGNDEVFVVGNLSLHVVEELTLHDGYGVVVPDGGLQQSLRVRRRGRRD